MYKYKYKYVSDCTRAAGGSDVDQVLGRLGDSSGRGPPLRALSCRCLTLLDFPDPAGVGVGRVRFVSRWPTPDHVFTKFPFRNVKCGAVRIKILKLRLNVAAIRTPGRARRPGYSEIRDS